MKAKDLVEEVKKTIVEKKKNKVKEIDKANERRQYEKEKLVKMLKLSVDELNWFKNMH